MPRATPSPKRVLRRVMRCGHSGAYLPYGFGGFVSQRAGGVTLPSTGQAGHQGKYGSSNSHMAIGNLPILFDIPPDQQALSGLQFGLGLTATYRLSPTGPNRQTEARLGPMGQSIALSADAKEKNRRTGRRLSLYRAGVWAGQSSRS